jgi:hypothetical protein
MHQVIPKLNSSYVPAFYSVNECIMRLFLLRRMEWGVVLRIPCRIVEWGNIEIMSIFIFQLFPNSST